MDLNRKISFDDTQIAFSYKTDSELWRANLIFSVVNLPWMSALVQKFAGLSMAMGLPFTGLIRKTVYAHFCGGEGTQAVEATINTLREHGIGVILHYAVEGQDTEAGFESTARETIRSIELARNFSSVPFCVLKTTGIASYRLLERVQTKQLLRPEEQVMMERVRHRFERICQAAHNNGISLLVDAEETWVQDTIEELAYSMMEEYNRERAVIYVTYQLYRTDALAKLREACERARSTNYILGVKIVRGAYMEQERDRSVSRGYPDPIQVDKEACDRAFNESLAFCVQNLDRIRLVCGTHNEQSNYLLTSLFESHGISSNDDRAWSAQLLGMSDNISFNLARAGYRVAKYVPYGPVRAVMPYLIRRAQENTSVANQISRELALVRKEIRRRKDSQAKS